MHKIPLSLAGMAVLMMMAFSSLELTKQKASSFEMHRIALHYKIKKIILRIPAFLMMYFSIP